LWSIAAGPLVNVALIPIFGALVFFARQSADLSPELLQLFLAVRFVNYGLLIFNLLPIYPLDGGQILRALLWFPLGQIRSLKIASAVGLIGSVALALFALWLRSFWVGLLAFFLLSQAVNGWRHAKTLAPETGTDLPPSDTAR
jgi:Zn-dependent protease